MKSSSGGGETLEWQQPHDGGASPRASRLAGAWQHGAAHRTPHPGVPGATRTFSPAPAFVGRVYGAAGAHAGLESPCQPWEGAEKWGMGQHALPKQRMGACHPQLQWVQMCADGVCALNSASTCACVGLELFVTGPRKVFQKL